MCGLILSVRIAPSDDKATSDDVFDALLPSISSRGPDSCQTHTSHVILDAGLTLEIKIAASVLALRGQGVTPQPVVGQRGVLGWNGQIFQGMSIGIDQNDTEKLFGRLEVGEAPKTILPAVEGPYAFIYFDLVQQVINFQLDPLSRRSLLVHPVSVEGISERFLLCSSRSEKGRELEIPMRVIDGGEGGVLDLKRIRLTAGGNKKLDLSQALNTSYLVDEHSDATWARVRDLNKDLLTANLRPHRFDIEVNDFLSNLVASVKRRVDNIRDPVSGQARVAMLFSGGVDCTLLAYLVHQCLPIADPIDLINVAFARSEAQDIRRDDSTSSEREYEVPDRLSGRDALEELRTTCPERQWRFVKVDVTQEEARQCRQAVLDLMYPCITVMDLSLAYPLYFASRGRGTIAGETWQPMEYTTRAKVYISGLGADEQLAGYIRHHRAYKRGGPSALLSELELDLSRLPTRNLSRDDRIIASHARDARYPYLDLSFVRYLSSLPYWLKCEPGEEGKGGDKKLLRVAARKCGLINASERTKRAMQFGTRSAKIGGERIKGSAKGAQFVRGIERD